MNGSQRLGGETFMVEADVILHTVNSDLASLSGIDRKTCPALMKKDNAVPVIGEFLQCNQPLDSDAPATFEREYLLDGKKTFDDQTGDSLNVAKDQQFQKSNHKAGLEMKEAVIVKNLNGKMGNGDNHGDVVKADISHAGDSSVCFLDPGAREEADGSASASAEASQRGQCEINTGQGQAVPDTHCITTGSQPGLAEPVRSSIPGSSASHLPDEDNPGGCSGDSGSLGHRESGPGAENPLAAKEPDLVIEVGGQKINAHKEILAEKSDYFKARLSRDILKVKGLSYKTLSVLIDYIYTSRMNVSKDTVVDVITGAKILQVPCAVQAAVDSMSEQLTAENCYEVLSIAKKQRLSELKETAYRFMSDHFLRVLRDPSVYGRLTGSERDLILRKRTEGRPTLMVAEVNDVFDRVGGSRPASRCSSRPQSPLSTASFEEGHAMYYYNETAGDWRALTAMPEDINTKGCGMCTMHNYLFVAGGIKGYGERGKVSDRVFYYNPVDDRWTEVRPLNQARAQLKLVSMDGHLYAIGGECLFTVERYDPRADRWTTVAPLPKGAFAVAHEATTCNGELYVSGGSLFYRLLKYEPKRDEWQECPYNSSRKRSSDMVALKSFVYRFDVHREQGVDVFKYNAIVKMWQDCASQSLGGVSPFRCAVIGNCIYCVNKSQTLRFVVEEEGAHFVEEALQPPLEAKGVLFPFVLSLPEKHEAVA
ncbi:kelch repeat and BTB domain-containing protein 11 isoform X1 [Gadus macrocephalus]|uniref:kelch repeat and BTB domain-containing protein 11 isoform X1 n=2 Tax=Gadus macrocephalus TaxID=80720 RepID=UPI0028CB7B88|nr:kelch repeat and BTB domain-containing protein 11 isoform X1 [Gadus macrocephalus]